MADKLTFKISSALKDIIGRDLITDDNIAVFELVKNAFDAYATRVDIYFENIYDDNSKIIIKDNGKGMDQDDLKNKWLFVAYSAKREGTEDEGFDYRDNIYQNRPFAGAKGIGRFSCDRLGTNLRLETTKKKKGAKTEVLITNWEKFESDLKDEFIDINVTHQTKKNADSHGTVLEISGLRSEWDRSKLLRLKDSLAKLINPSRGKGEHKFRIFIHVPEEIDNDSRAEGDYDVINGEVKNFIFETLELKTTQIITEISDDGKFIISELRDGGTLIYKIKEKNEYSLLKGITYTLFYLNQSAKLTFGRRMGLSTTKYGNIFLYKNGFRIYPFGEPGEDPLKVNVRYAQGYNRYLGLRNLMGRIEIFGENYQLRETTSRGDGLIKTATYDSLLTAFEEKALKRLEKYVIDVQQWGLSIEEDLNEQDELAFKTSITELIAKLTDASEVVDIQYGDDFIEILKDSQNESVFAVLTNLKRIAKETGNDKLLSQANTAEKKLTQLKTAKEEAEREVEEIKDELEDKESENLFLKSIKSQDFEEVVSFLHHIGIAAKNIDNNLKLLIKKVRKRKTISNEELSDILQKVIFENRKVLSISKFASKANFKLFTATATVDVVEYITEYIQNILGLVPTQKPEIHLTEGQEIKFIKEIKPIELNIIIDNLISNSRRAKAENIYISFAVKGTKLTLSFVDDGKGIDSEIAENIFDFGFTTTAGSGIGLYHIKKLLNEQKGNIELNTRNSKFTEFVLTINK